MQNKKIIFLFGITIGILLVLLAGSANQTITRLSGSLQVNTNNGMYQSCFSSVNENNEAYLAVTNTVTGQTEVFAITKNVREKLSDIPSGKQGSYLFELQSMR
jgi:hypothetical protein